MDIPCLYIMCTEKYPTPCYRLKVGDFVIKDILTHKAKVVRIKAINENGPYGECWYVDENHRELIGWGPKTLTARYSV